MTNNKLTELGARRIGEAAIDARSVMEEIESKLPISSAYRIILIHYNGAVVFDRGARFKMDEPSPLNDNEGYQCLELLYGLGGSKHSITNKAAQYAEELPESFVPIGESSGGNLICVDKSGVVYLWDHESLPGEGYWQISSDINGFIDRLEADDSNIDSSSGIIDSESFLDF